MSGGALDAARTALADAPAWLVGGALRDRSLGRATDDVDVVVDGDAAAAARRVARAAGGPAFPLSDAFGAWRVLAPDRGWRVDLTPMRGGSLEADLGLRDFTINAMAEPLGGGGLVDPFGGAGDLAARRLRMVGPGAFADDPLRTLRVARLACELGLEVEAATLAAARAHAGGLGGVAGERVFAELRRLLAAQEALAGLRLMDELGATAAVLPELDLLRGVEQSPYHHLDVREHTLAVLAQVIEIERDPGPALGKHAQAAAALLAEPLADELTRGQALRLGALLHDIAKPATRAVTREGRITFIGHDREGAAMARAVLERLRASERLRAHVAALARHHLRLGFLVHERPLSRRQVWSYLTETGPVAVDVTILSIADRLATRGRKADEAIASHLELADRMLGEALAHRAAPRATPLVRGDELAATLGIATGPALGRLLAELEAARFAGEVSTREEAIAHARALVGEERG
jgi:poly(A) polymerase